MNNRILLTVVVVISLAGVVLGLVVNARNNSVSLETGSSGVRTVDVNQVASSPTSAPSPTIPVLSRKVKSIDSTTIVITGTSGDLRLPKNSPILKYFIHSGKTTTPATMDDVKVGQNVTYKLIVPGKEAQLIIEE